MRVGNFEIEVSEPFPCWITLRHLENGRIKDQEIHGVRHEELRDLSYALMWAAQECKRKLPEKYRWEV